MVNSACAPAAAASKRELLILDEALCLRHPGVKEQCCAILNAEWPRSAALRRRTLDASSAGSLPAVTALVQWFPDRSSPSVLGTARVTPVPAEAAAVWIESVVS